MMNENRVATFENMTTAIIQRLEAIAVQRDEALVAGRQIVRLSANSVRATHRGDPAAAGALLDQARSRLVPLIDLLSSTPDILNAGYVQDAMREYSEAYLTAAIVEDEAIPGPADLGLGDSAYLNGMAEAASELRRRVLDLLRAGDLDQAEHLLRAMDEIYAALMLVDFPDAITGGLRRSVDALRAVIERTRGDVTTAVGQHRLTIELRRVHTQLESLSQDRSGDQRLGE